MNISPKYITVVYLFIITMLLAFTSVQHHDTKNRQQEICEQIKTFSPDCRIE